MIITLRIYAEDLISHWITKIFTLLQSCQIFMGWKVNTVKRRNVDFLRQLEAFLDICDIRSLCKICLKKCKTEWEPIKWGTNITTVEFINHRVVGILICHFTNIL